MASKLTQNLNEATIVDKTGDRVPIYSAASPSELRYMTPDNLVPDASTTVEGKVELATDAEAATNTDNTRAITPSNGQSLVAGAVVAAAGKTTPVDADSFPLVDSAASNGLKELTLANLKTALGLPISLSSAWPIGSVYIAVVSTNPATLLGFGTWSAFATGRTLVGIDTGQTEFDTVEETGGAKTHTLTVAEMPSHQHTSDAAATSVTGSAAHDSAGGGLNQRASGLTAIPLQGGGGAHNNLQPYIVTYMWKRTA